MSSGIGYRPEIDGLRAVAVVPVVLFHAGVPLISGGYVGVDIFFVISGYLITGILLASMRTNTFSIVHFYERRIKRIFPALFVVLAASSAAAWAFLTPERLVDFGESMAATSVFGSNFYFWKSVDYFSTNAHVQPLLHTWSLAVEEQFYIFYPLLLYVVTRLRLPLHWILVAGGTLSLLAAVAMLYVMPGAVFYLLPFRAWELIVGGLIAAGVPSATNSTRVRLGAALLGMALMIGPMVCYTVDTAFPGLAAAPPVIGAALVIWSSASAVHRLLSTAPFLVVGKASYSFYLWHFPLFAFAAYLSNAPLDPATGLALSIAALLLALVSLRWVESPVRHSRSKAAWAVPLALIAVAGAAGLVLARSDGFPLRLPLEARTIIDAAADKSRHPLECMSTGFSLVAKPCLIGTTGAPPVALLWGDSHAMVTATAMKVAAKRAGTSFLFLATADCPPGLGFTISPDYQPGLSTSPAYRHCADYNRQMLELAINSPNLRSVVISSRWSNWRIGEPGNPVESAVDLRLADATGPAASPADNARIFEAGFRRLVDALNQSGKAVYIVGPVAEPEFDVPQALFVSRFGLFSPDLAIPEANFERRHRHALAILNRAEGVHMLWPHRVLCGTNGCPLARNGRPTYLDHNHLSVPEAERTAGLFADVMAAR
jgi:peptidoglycan/LPS O-acetylase OafA/YrhL